MKPARIDPAQRSAPKDAREPDRLTQVLIVVAFFLIAAMAALLVDFWLEPPASSPVAEALELLPPVATDVPATLEPTPRPPSPAPTAGEPIVPSAGSAAEMTPTLPITVPATVGVTPPACVPPDDWTIHVVQQGNTLYSLSRRYGTDVDTLMLVNCLNTHTIFIGQQLYVPGPPVPPTAIAAVPTATPLVWLPSATPQPGASTTPPAPLDSAPGQAAVPTPTPTAPFAATIPGNYLNIVLLGSDRRPNSGAWRTDSMIIVSVDQQNKIVRLLSIPRDLWVYIPAHGYNRINTADLWGELAKTGGGPERVKQTIYQNLGIPIHYYVRVDFQGFIKIVDTVGGLDIDVECPLPDISLTAGIHHFDGKHALRYARSRKSSNDFDRGRRQRKVLMALWEQALTLDVVPRLPELWVTMADSFKTDLPLEQVINLAYLGTQIKRQHIRSRAIDASMTQGWVTPEGASVLLPREDRIRAMLNSFYAPLQAQTLDSGEQVRIQVLNGWQRSEAEQLAASALRWEGYKVVGAGTAERQDYHQTAITVYGDNLAAGQAVAGILGVPLTAIKQEAGPGGVAEVRVILGADYNPCQH